MKNMKTKGVNSTSFSVHNCPNSKPTDSIIAQSLSKTAVSSASKIVNRPMGFDC